MRTMQMSVGNKREGSAVAQDAARRGLVIFAELVCFAALSAYAPGQGSVATPGATQTSNNSQQERTATSPVDGADAVEVEPRQAQKRPERADSNREIFYRHK